MKIRRFTEEAGFDDEEMKSQYEIPNLMGEFEIDSPTLRPFYTHSDKINTESELKKLFYRFPIIEIFRRDDKRFEGSLLTSFYATSKEPLEDDAEFYAQLSFAYHDEQYYIGTVLRNIEDHENEDEWVRHTFFFDTLDETFKVAEAFVHVCKRLNIIDSSDLLPFTPNLN
jgi:hypothetical protein